MTYSPTPPVAKPLPDLARGYYALRSLAQPLLSIVLPAVTLFSLGMASIGTTLLTGAGGAGLMGTLVGLLCLVAGAVATSLTVRSMVAHYPSSPRQVGTLSLLGLALPVLGFIILMIAPTLSASFWFPGPGSWAPSIACFLLFALGILVVPATALTHALNMRRVERRYGPSGVTALWALQQGQLGAEYEHLARLDQPPGFPAP